MIQLIYDAHGKSDECATEQKIVRGGKYRKKEKKMSNESRQEHDCEISRHTNTEPCQAKPNLTAICVFLFPDINMFHVC